MTKKPTQRDFGNWIDAFIEATAHTGCPESFRRWGAVSCIAGVLERRVWVHTKGSNLYSNLYIILCSRPGIGKTEISDRVRQLWKDIPGTHVAPSNLSRASLADSLADAKVVHPGLEYNALQASINELGVLLPSYDMDFLSALTDLYDCKNYTERKRGSNLKIDIPDPYMNLLACTQPGFMQTLLPEVAWEQGFMSRCVIIFSGQKMIPDDLFEVPETKLSHLMPDLKIMRTMRGKFGWTDEAKLFINTWNRSGGDPAPIHPKLSNYNTRRTAHLLKLSQIMSAARSNELLITEVDVRLGLQTMTNAEAEMENIFKSMASGGDSSVISEAYHFLWTNYIRSKKQPIAASRLHAFLMDRTDAYKVRHIIEIMEKSGMISVAVLSGKTAYKPQAKGGERV